VNTFSYTPSLQDPQTGQQQGTYTDATLPTRPASRSPVGSILTHVPPYKTRKQVADWEHRYTHPSLQDPQAGHRLGTHTNTRPSLQDPHTAKMEGLF
jgi:hypothetical protein